MTQKLSPIQTSIAHMERLYSTLTAPTGLDFTDESVELIMSCTPYHPDTSRFTLLAGAILADWNLERRELFLQRVPHTQDLITAIEAPSWPEPKEYPEDLAKFTDEEDLAYRHRMIATINQYAEDQSARVMARGFRKAMTNVIRLQEMQTFMKALAEGATPDPQDYPYLHSEVGITGVTLEEVAYRYYQTTQAWNYVNVQIETAYRSAEMMIMNAGQVGDIAIFVQNARAIMRSAVDTLLGVNTPQPEDPVDPVGDDGETDLTDPVS